MRRYTALKSPKWLPRVEDYYREAQVIRKLNGEKLPYYKSKDAAYYFMGVAYYESFNFRQAEELLARARAQSKWQSMIAVLQNKVHKFLRASADLTLGDIATKIAVKDEVTRADLAALIVSELNLIRSSYGGAPLPR